MFEDAELEEIRNASLSMSARSGADDLDNEEEEKHSEVM